MRGLQSFNAPHPPFFPLNVTEGIFGNLTKSAWFGFTFAIKRNQLKAKQLKFSRFLLALKTFAWDAFSSK